ncbi:putative Zn-dependent peptidase [Xenococcus sp. PCC 7305]|uniref:M16 family metallopeptidase n=1 Tax=Xenococcus sp. PCC 7305 TaxID=102125 RepID=UPI0002AC6102|nr:pitrilysin family protein [Xenococcus sp. PCC 7305]ELS04555.1 putative Zn-dependent peptidase [Xenococcus sp. PCC 7305]
MTTKKSRNIIYGLCLGCLTILLLFITNIPVTATSPEAISQITQRLSTEKIAPKHYTELEFSPPPEIRLPEYLRYQLDNGMVVYLVEDRDFPLISGSAVIRTGSRFEPQDKVGLAQLTGNVMRSGGTINHPSEELNLILEQNAASIESAISRTSGTVSFSTLTEDLDTVLELFAEVIRQPAFDPEQLQLIQNQQKGAISRRNDNPQEISQREFNKLIYGSLSPYARTTEYETVDNISREDVVNFYEKFVRPENIILGIVGDFETSQMQGMLEEKFGDWQVNLPAPTLDIPTATQKYTSGVFVVDRPNLTQSSVLLGHLGGLLKTPDYPQISVLNGVINGFGGRLFNEVRSRQGLAYSVYGIWNPNYDYPGTFTAGGQTQSETTVPFIESILAELEKVQDNLITEQELANAKESILNSFVFNFQTPSQTLSRLMRYEYFGYPQDFIFQYQKGIKATTVEDIQRVAQKYLALDKIVILVVGNSASISPSLESLSPEVTFLDISIPQAAI